MMNYSNLNFNQSLINIVRYEMRKIMQDHNYYGSEDQIELENMIVKQVELEMRDDEAIEEYYQRVINNIEWWTLYSIKE